MAEAFEFQVDSIDANGRVLGRNGDAGIPLGTVFTAIRRCRVLRDSDGYHTEDLGKVGSIALSLRKVHFYQHSIDNIPSGHTAAIEIEGDGLDVLADLLSVLPPHEYLWIVSSRNDAV